MKVEQLTEEVMSELSFESNEMIRIIGKKKFLEVVRFFGGGTVYVPKEDRIVKHWRNKSILKDFDGANYNELRVKYNLSENVIRKMIKVGLEEKKKEKGS
ncbi:Mor transcription activator family protein [Pilibacter termitis]|uniref:Mor transcription activator family protein n=1 Tax=Pilibacter termitis TaxID=263852 RepID=A0A1T4L4A5_9ENTE|nr:Mor transcription activator family protein [Pilibacter termitis]SJZ49562.1 Mor transcription activator family protein [Pilibacter termitis]